MKIEIGDRLILYGEVPIIVQGVIDDSVVFIYSHTGEISSINLGYLMEVSKKDPKHMLRRKLNDDKT